LGCKCCIFFLKYPKIDYFFMGVNCAASACLTAAAHAVNAVNAASAAHAVNAAHAVESQRFEN
jgi:hypothetical protein